MPEDPVKIMLTKARVRLLIAHPFFASIATEMELVEAPWCRTLATDGRHLFWSREWVKAHTVKQVMFGIAHEVLHAILDHIGRGASRKNQDLVNMAMDYVVNYILEQERIGSRPPNTLYDARFTDEMYWEEVYDLLQRNSVDVALTFDDHLSADTGETEVPGESTADITITGRDGVPKISADDLAKIREQVKASVVRAVQQVGAGNVPAAIRRMVRDLLEPKIDWRSLLDAHMRSAIKDDSTFSTRSRRSFHLPYYLPGHVLLDELEADVCIDGSGSITDEMVREFLSEIRGIAATFRAYRIRVWTFDTKVYNPQLFMPETIDRLPEYEFIGGGGTLYECNWEYMKANEIKPHRLIMFTDGDPNQGWGDPHYCETLFVIKGRRHIVAPFGQTAYFESARTAVT